MLVTRGSHRPLVIFWLEGTLQDGPNCVLEVFCHCKTFLPLNPPYLHLHPAILVNRNFKFLHLHIQSSSDQPVYRRVPLDQLSGLYVPSGQAELPFTINREGELESRLSPGCRW